MNKPPANNVPMMSSAIWLQHASEARAWTRLYFAVHVGYPSTNVSMVHIILEAELLTTVMAGEMVELRFPLPPFPMQSLVRSSETHATHNVVKLAHVYIYLQDSAGDKYET